MKYLWAFLAFLFDLARSAFFLVLLLAIMFLFVAGIIKVYDAASNTVCVADSSGSTAACVYNKKHGPPNVFIWKGSK